MPRASAVLNETQQWFPPIDSLWFRHHRKIDDTFIKLCNRPWDTCDFYTLLGKGHFDQAPYPFDVSFFAEQGSTFYTDFLDVAWIYRRESLNFWRGGGCDWTDSSTCATTVTNSYWWDTIQFCSFGVFSQWCAVVSMFVHLRAWGYALIVVRIYLFRRYLPLYEKPLFRRLHLRPGIRGIEIREIGSTMSGLARFLSVLVFNFRALDMVRLSPLDHHLAILLKETELEVTMLCHNVATSILTQTNAIAEVSCAIVWSFRDLKHMWEFQTSDVELDVINRLINGL